MLGVLINDGSDDALHGAKLWVEAEEHEHEEEEATPEGGERHLQDRAGVSQERKSGSCKVTSKWFQSDLFDIETSLQFSKLRISINDWHG